MTAIRLSRPEDGQRALEIWAAAVDTTHDFLSREDRLAIGDEVAGFLPGTPMVLAVDASDRPLGFMIVDEGSIEALFVDAACHGQGVGKALIRHAVEVLGARRLEVNEQNHGARAFYRRMGFVETGRNAVDSQGRPYPLITMELRD
jgi:putative acetyltransferase